MSELGNDWHRRLETFLDEELKYNFWYRTKPNPGGHWFDQSVWNDLYGADSDDSSGSDATRPGTPRPEELIPIKASK